MSTKRSITRWLAGVLLAVPLLFAFLGPFLEPLAPQGNQAPFGTSNWSPFGTDRLGRDVLAAAMQGGHSLILVTLATVLCAYAAGFLLGVLAAAAPRPWLEDLLMRPIDVLLCLPSLLIIIVAAVRTNGSALAVACAVGLTLLAPITRFVRMAARGIVQGPVMDALRMQGEGRYQRYVRYAAARLARPIAADLGVRITATIYLLASANFLGLGFDTTSPDWAVSVSANKDGIAVAPWSVFLPAALIVMLVVGINLLWDSLLADPRAIAAADAVRGSSDG